MELLITMSIVGIIAAISSPMVIGSQYSSEIKSNVLLVNSLIQKAKNLATTGNVSDVAGGVPTFGYGVNFSSNHKVTLFINTFNGADYKYEAGSDEDVGDVSTNDTIVFPNNIGIDMFSTDGVGAAIPSSLGANIFFIPPEGSIGITNNSIGSTSHSFNNEITIILKHYEGNRCYMFNLNKTTSRLYDQKTNCP